MSQSPPLSALPVASSLHRRRFLQVGSSLALGSAAALSGVSVAAAAPGRVARPRSGRAKNVIFMVSDGMSHGTLTLADTVRRMKTGQPSAWLKLIARDDARRALVETSASNSLVTDSAAGGSAWGNGQKTPFQSVNVLADGSSPVPILVHARQQGKQTGLVTTTRLTHATPASFIANVPDRNMESDIARQMLERGFDVALGGGARYFTPALLAPAKGLGVVRTADALAGAMGGRVEPLLGLFWPTHLPHELDRPASVPSLAELTRAALDVLAPGPNGFVLQVEGGRVDHAAHANDAGSLIAEQLAFDDAIAVALAFAEAKGDTLVILTSDHGNANPGLTLYEKAGQRGLEVAASAKHSFEWIFQQLGAKLSFDDPDDFRNLKDIEPVRDLVMQATGIELKPEELDQLFSALRGQPRHPFVAQHKATSILGGLLGAYNAIGFASPNHTSDLVEAAAWGPGSEMLKPFMINTELHTMMVKAMDLAPAKSV